MRFSQATGTPDRVVHPVLWRERLVGYLAYVNEQPDGCWSPTACATSLGHPVLPSSRRLSVSRAHGADAQSDSGTAPISLREPGRREKAAEEPIGSEWLTSSTSNVALVLTTRPAPENDSPPTAVLFTRFSHPGKTRGLDRPGAATLAAISWLSASTDKLIYYNG